MHPSSTPSSRTLRIDTWRAPGLAWAIVLLLAVEFGLARQDWFWTKVGVSAVEEIEQLMIAPAQQPLVVAMGSSRIEYGLAPRVMEASLGLPEGSVLNVAMGGGTAFDALTMYRRNRDKLSQAKLLIVGIDDWYYNAGWPVNPRDARFATWSERLEDYESPVREKLLFGWLWHTTELQVVASTFIRATALPQPLVLEPDGRMIKQHDPALTRDNVLPMAEVFYGSYQFQMTRHKQLQKLIDLADEDGLQVLVVQVPLRDEYIDLVQSRWPAEWRRYRETAETLKGATVLLYGKGSAVGMGDADIYDYGHCTAEGAAKFTRLLAKEVDARYPELLKPAAATR